MDVEGSIVVSPATDEHVLVANAIQQQLSAACPAGVVVLVEGLRWSPTGGVQPSFIPDVSVLDRRAIARPEGVLGLDPPPLIVSRFSPPRAARRDLGEKAAGYFAGGAFAYWTVEVPGLTDVDVVTLTIRVRGGDGWIVVEVFHGGLAAIGTPFDVRIDLDALLG